MSYGGVEYAGGVYAGPRAVAAAAEVTPNLAVEISFTTGALETPVWVDVTSDVQSWDVLRGRTRELERMQPGRCTVVFNNLSRDYDALYADGPWFGNLKPRRRMRIRETFDGVTHTTFDGFVNSWNLDYPMSGKNATATMIATDATMFFAGTVLPRSVYTHEVEQDSPVLWWRLDETSSDASSAALNAGSLATAGDGTYVGPVRARGSQGLIDRDPGTAIEVQDPGGLVAVPDMGVMIADSAFDISDTGSWAIEFWCRPAGEPIGVDQWVHGENASGDARLVVQSSGSEAWQFRLVNSTDAAEYGVTGNAADQVANTRYHIVAKFGPDKAMAIYVNGTKYTTTATGVTAPPLVGTIHPNMDLGFLYTFGDGQTPEAIGDEFAVYTSALGVDPLPDDRVTAHYEAGTIAWQDDQPAERAGRVLDLVGWPDDQRVMDDGNVALQAAQLGVTALEHLQKIAETEFGLLFVSKEGNVRLIERSALEARVSQATFGTDSSSGEIGYRAISFLDGDQVIRNRATISRLNGVAKQSVSPTSVDEFGQFDYVLDGLLHRFDSYSQDYADFVTAEYSLPRRRVSRLTLGPAAPEAAGVLIPQMLGRELGDAVTVLHRPPGGGDPFEQVCVIEGIEHSGAPGAPRRTTKWVLSPEFSESMF